MSTLEEQLASIGSRLDVEAPAITEVEVKSRLRGTDFGDRDGRPWRLLAAALAAAAIVVLVVALAQMSDGAAELEPADTPKPTDVPAIDITWSPIDQVDVFQYLQVNGNAVATNGSSYLVQRGDPNQPLKGPTWWRSEDAVTWEAVRLPETYRQNFINGTIGVQRHFVLGDKRTPGVWVSEDGIAWSKETSSMESAATTLFSQVFRFDTLDGVLAVNPPDLDPMDAFNSALIEFDGRYLQLGTNSTRTFTASISTDGETWLDVTADVPFASILTREYLEDRWQHMWSCEVAANNGHAAVLLEAETGPAVWETQDGLDWTTVPAEFDIPEAWNTVCIHALDEGWLIAPRSPSLIDTLLYSPDLRTWHQIDTPQNPTDLPRMVPTVAGNKVFLLAPDPTTLNNSSWPTYATAHVADVRS